jgi:hypothetical protein
LEKFLKASYIEIAPKNQGYNQIQTLGHNAGDISFKLIIKIIFFMKNTLKRISNFLQRMQLTL